MKRKGFILAVLIGIALGAAMGVAPSPWLAPSDWINSGYPG